MSRKPAKEAPGYSLHKEADGRIYIYEGGVRHSRYGIQPADEHEQRLLEAVLEILNTGYTDVRLRAAAFSMYVHRLW